jgi:hypothetical protein
MRSPFKSLQNNKSNDEATMHRLAIRAGDCGTEVTLRSTPTKSLLDSESSTPSPFKKTPFCGANEDMWTWQYFFGDQKQQQRNQDESPRQEDDLKRVLHNRAFNVEARNKRLSSLRRNLQPFQPSPVRLQRGGSLNHVGKSSFSSPKKMKMRVVTPEKTTSPWHCGMNCALQQPVTPEKSLPVIIDDQDCYDSDPEDFLRPSNLPTIVRVPSTLSSSEQALMNQRHTLILHDSGPSYPVHVWIERGQHLATESIPPKLVWKPVNRRPFKKSYQNLEVQCINLLDIQRVLTLTKVDRKRHPLVKPSCCFIVKTLTKSLLLEASCQQQRDGIAESLKQCVARLGSMILVDSDELQEYFAGGAIMGPGEEPEWPSCSQHL